MCGNIWLSVTHYKRDCYISYFIFKPFRPPNQNNKSIAHLDSIRNCVLLWDLTFQQPLKKIQVSLSILLSVSRLFYVWKIRYLAVRLFFMYVPSFWIHVQCSIFRCMYRGLFSTGAMGVLAPAIFKIRLFLALAIFWHFIMYDPNPNMILF